MHTVKIYQNRSGELTAAVYEDGLFSNFIPSLEMELLDVGDFFEEARMGFPEAILYEDDVMLCSPEKAAKREEEESDLIAEIGEGITMYPGRLSSANRELLQIMLGDEVWAKIEDLADENGCAVIPEE